MMRDRNTESVTCQTPVVLGETSTLVGMGKPVETSPFWLRLTEARTLRGLSMDQQVIARELNVYQSAVTKWKTGKGLPTLDRCIELAVTARVCVEWLLTGRAPKYPAGAGDAEFDSLMAAWDQLSTSAKREVVSFAIFHVRGLDRPADSRSTTKPRIGH